MNASFLQFARSWSRASGVVVIAIGSIGIVGVATRSVALQTAFTGGVGMKFNTAVCFACVGTALLLQMYRAPLGGHSVPSRGLRGIIIGLAAFTALVGLMTFIQHLTGLNFHIDQLLVTDRSNMLATASPGRMGPPASLNFFLSGVSLMLLTSESRLRIAIAQSLASIVALIALLAIIGYAYDVRPLYGISRLTGIAIHTALTFLVLATGLLATRPTAGPISVFARNDAGGAMARRLMVPAVAIPFALGWLRTIAERRNWIEDALGRPLLVLSLIVSFVSLVWWNARALSTLGRSRATAEQALRESEERWELAVNAANDGIWDWVPGTDTIYWSPRCKEMLGYADAELATSLDVVRDLMHPDDRERGWTTAGRHLRGETSSYADEYRLRHKDGTYRWVLARGMAIRDGSGQPFRFTGSHTDITDRKRAEAERERLLEAERAARAEAERASRVKDEFLSTVSHELRTPLNAILGWSHIIRQSRTENEDVQQGIEVIERNARMQTQIIEDLLDMSRIISGKLRLRVQEVEVAKVIDVAIETVQAAADAKRIAITRSIEAGAPSSPIVLRCDADRLQQVVWNLLSNAIKFTPEGGQIDIRARRLDRSVELVVSDNGQGIDAEFLPLVFDKFRQADSSTSRKHGGLGLGLAIVKHLIELHGGSVRAASEGTGRGATFTVSLPIEAGAAVARTGERLQQAPHERSRVNGDCARLRDVSVLVVDDEADARELTRRLLEDVEASVVVADSAHDALAALDEHRVDVVVCDIGMPGVDGYDLIRAIRARGPANGGNVPAVALTAFARAEDQTRAIAAGFQTHLAKPIVPDELLMTVANLAGKTAGRRID